MSETGENILGEETPDESDMTCERLWGIVIFRETDDQGKVHVEGRVDPRIFRAMMDTGNINIESEASVITVLNFLENWYRILPSFKGAIREVVYDTLHGIFVEDSGMTEDEAKKLLLEVAKE